MRLRQVALVAKDLDPVRETLFRLLGVDEAFADENVAYFGLKNCVITVGDTFLEVVTPVEEGTTAGRLLERRGGDGGYMVIFQVDDLALERRRVDALGLRTVWDFDSAEAKTVHLHPKDVSGAIVSLDEMSPPEQWQWAGAGWQGRAARNVTAIAGVEMQAAEPAAMAARWAAVCGRELCADGGALQLSLDFGFVRFVERRDGRGDGIATVYFGTADIDAVREAARTLKLNMNGSALTFCGVEFAFID